MDHIPFLNESTKKKLSKGEIRTQFLCSKITKETAEARTNGNFSIPEKNWLLGQNLHKKQKINYQGVELSLIPNGHTYGSMSLLIEGSEVILYTSDFITQDRVFISGKTSLKGLRPIQCDYLVMECTYGSPKYKFPSFREIKAELNEYINNQIKNKSPVILLGYAFGKSQNILNMLKNNFKIILERNIAKLTKILEKNKINFNKWEPYGKYNKNILKELKDYILITSPYSIFIEPFKSLILNGAKIVSMSGKILNPAYKDDFPANIYIPFSDHCDFNGLLQFITDCNVKNIFLEHGCIEIFSYLLKQNLQIPNISILT